MPATTLEIRPGVLVGDGVRLARLVWQFPSSANVIERDRLCSSTLNPSVCHENVNARPSKPAIQEKDGEDLHPPAGCGSKRRSRWIWIVSRLRAGSTQSPCPRGDLPSVQGMVAPAGRMPVEPTNCLLRPRLRGRGQSARHSSMASGSAVPRLHCVHRGGVGGSFRPPWRCCVRTRGNTHHASLFPFSSWRLTVWRMWVGPILSQTDVALGDHVLV